MAEQPSPTPAPEPAGPEGTPPAATPPQPAPPAATDDDEVVSIKKSDLKKLQSQRDGNHERARQTEYQVALMLQKEDIGKYLAENKTKFPDVRTDDLLDAESDEDFEKLAGQTQARIDEAAQRRLGDLQRADTPTISPKEKAARLKQLQENPGSASFQEMLTLQSQ